MIPARTIESLLTTGDKRFNVKLNAEYKVGSAMVTVGVYKPKGKIYAAGAIRYKDRPANDLVNNVALEIVDRLLYHKEDLVGAWSFDIDTLKVTINGEKYELTFDAPLPPTPDVALRNGLEIILQRGY